MGTKDPTPKVDPSEAQGVPGAATNAKNDIAWYSHNPALLAAAGSIPFPYRPGMKLPFVSNLGDITTVDVRQESIPGVFAIGFVPSVGYSSTPTDPASIVAKEVFAKVREVYSGRIAVDPPDFVIYLMALDSIFAAIADLKRVYRIINYYSPDNLVVPNDLLRSLGLSEYVIENLRLNRIKFFQLINELVGMTRKFRCPAVMDIFNRHYWMNDNVYTDDATINSQFYVFVQESFYQFSLVDHNSVKVGGLVATTPTWRSITSGDAAESAYNYVKSLIDALGGSDDAYIISGYLMRAFENEPAFAVDELQQLEMLIPKFEPEVLAQIENSSALPFYIWNGRGLSALDLTISQDPSTNSVLSTPAVNSTNVLTNVAEQDFVAAGIKLRPTISLRTDIPSAADVVIATRLKTWFKNFTTGADNVVTYDIVAASEIVVYHSMWYRRYTGTSNSILARAWITGVDCYTPSSQIATILPDFGQTALLTSFDWHPIRYVATRDTKTTGNNMWTITLMGDLHNTTTMETLALENINRVCLYSEFNAFGQI